MALKLGKCRLCLKLGDFYSIFAVDNSVQLAEMVMECTRIKVYEGDGLPDKVCSECVQKLSSAYIFKQQCERADQELRRNYVPPPGFSISPPPPNRQSSDSAFSTHTDSSNLKSSFTENKATPINRSRKRSTESDNASEASRSAECSRPGAGRRVEELRRSQKRPRASEHSDYDDTGGSSYQPDTDLDSDEPLLDPQRHKCHYCPKTFKSNKTLKAHLKNLHGINDSFRGAPQPPAAEDDGTADELRCARCDKTFKLKIMLNRHQETCAGADEHDEPAPAPTRLKKELFITLQPIDAVHKTSPKKPSCEYCTATFKTVDNLEKHLRVVHAAVLKSEPEGERLKFKESSTAVRLPCLYCGDTFDDYYVHQSHFNTCPRRDARTVYVCPICRKVSNRKNGYVTHIKNAHFEPRAATAGEHRCRVCGKTLQSQESLVQHLAAHASNIDDDEDGAAPDDGDSRLSALDDSASALSAPAAEPLRCRTCDKEFKYRKSLASHELKHVEDEARVKTEPEASLLSEQRPRSEPESSPDEDADDLTCDVCEKMFSYKRLLDHHKRTKHNMSSGTKRAKINLKDCSVRCLLCDLDMKVSDINHHNQQHTAKNIKPRNIYTCAECNQKFKSCTNLANHIKLVHRLKQSQEDVPQKYQGVDMADFCEVVVTKAEPLDEIQSHNGFGNEVPLKAAATVDLSGFTCPTCGKKMPTLISLKRHINWHSNVGNNLEKKHECFVCKETFKFMCHYKVHMRAHYRDPNIDPALLVCAICNRRSKHLRAAQAHMAYHKQTRFQNKDYQCSICKRVFQYRKVYLAHMAIHYKKGESAMNTVVGDAAPQAAPAADSAACHLCGKVCLNEVSLKHHLAWHNSKTLLFGARHECPHCTLQFTNKRHLELHVRAHYEAEDGPHRCHVCGKRYLDESYLRRHIKGHNFDHSSHRARLERLRRDKVKCPICPRHYRDLPHLIRHLRRTHPTSKMIKVDPDAAPAPPLACKLCAKPFGSEARLRSHEEMHLRKPNFFRCKFCGKKTISLKAHNVHIKAHLTRKHVDSPLQCPRCDRTFVWGYALHHHVRDDHGVTETWIAERADVPLQGPLRELQCAVCLKVLASRSNFERHLDYHNSLRCNYCHDYFGGLRFLEGHLAFACERRRLLGNSEPHPRRVKCRVCYKPFHLQVKLDCHMRTAHGVTVERARAAPSADTVCDFCFRTFENEDALAGHKLYHRSVGYFGCIYCSRKFNTRTAFNKHKTHHLYTMNTDDPTKCEHCDRTFVLFRDMIEHMREEHGDDKDWLVPPKEVVEEECPVCHKRFYNLPRHLRYHEENRCRKCGEYFYSRTDCDNHLCAVDSDAEAAAPDGAPPPAYEECAFCFKPITKKDSRRKHDILHSTSGAISCRFCPLKFKTLDAFNIHAFSHRSRKYVKRPIKCRVCKERFVQYGAFMRHMKAAHGCTKKLHYRATVRRERCVVCSECLPNLHNHYRAHLAHRCASCGLYVASARLFAQHRCDEPPAEPDKVFRSDADLPALIASYVAKDEKDDEKFYGYTDDEEENEPAPAPDSTPAADSASAPGPTPKRAPKTYSRKKPVLDPQLAEDERRLHMMVTSPIISDVLSLYQQDAADVVALSDDSLDAVDLHAPVVVIDD